MRGRNNVTKKGGANWGETEWQPTPVSPGTYLVVGLGGGGDALSALPAVSYLQESGCRVVLGNVHFSTSPTRLLALCDRRFGQSGGQLTTAIVRDGRARPTEVVVGRALDVPAISFVANYGAAALSASFRAVINEFEIDSIWAVDGGTDSLAAFDTNVTTVVTDAIALRALGQQEIGASPVIALIGACADNEMSIRQFLSRVARAADAGGLLGILPFPPGLLAQYEHLLRKVQATFPSFVSEAVYRAASGEIGSFVNCYGRDVELSPLQALTFLFSTDYVVEEVNPFVRAVDPHADYEAVVTAIAELLRRNLGGGRAWTEQIRD